MPKSAVIETYQYLTGSWGKRGGASNAAVGRQVRETIIPRRMREAFIAHARLVVDHGLTAGTLTEMSQRLDEALFIITAPGSWAATFGEDDLRIGAIHEQKSLAQEEMPRHAQWHRLIYGAGVADAVLLSQPPAALTAAALRLVPAPELLVDAAADIGSLAVFEIVDPAILPSDDELVGRHALLLPGYGLLSWGDDLSQAIARAEMVNRWCDIMLRSCKFNER